MKPESQIDVRNQERSAEQIDVESCSWARGCRNNSEKSMPETSIDETPQLEEGCGNLGKRPRGIAEWRNRVEPAGDPLRSRRQLLLPHLQHECHTTPTAMTYASSFGARLQPQSVVSRSSLRHPAPRRGRLQHLVPLFPDRSFTTGQAPLLPVVQEVLQSHSLVFRNPPNPPLWYPLWTSFSQHQVTVHCGSNCCSLAPLCCPLLSSDHMLCSCHLDIPQAPPHLPTQPTLPPFTRVRDWSTVVASCDHSLSVWHQSVLAHVSCPFPDFPARASTLDSLFSSLTQILFDSASLRSRRRPTVFRPRTRQPFWWNDACYHTFCRSQWLLA